MDWKFLYLEPKGRIGQKDFWIGFAILFAASMVVGMVLVPALIAFPLIGTAFNLALLFPYYCLSAKRLHDIGKPETLALVVAGANGVLTLLSAFLLPSAAAIAANPLAAGAGLGMAAMLVPLSMIVGLCSLAFLLWVGLTRGEDGVNAYGAPRASMFGGSTTTPVA